jgi:signal transduction histidine kinase
VFWQIFFLRLCLVATFWLTALFVRWPRSQKFVYLLFYVSSAVIMQVIVGLMLIVNRDPTGPFWVFFFLMAVYGVAYPWPAAVMNASLCTILVIYVIAGILAGGLADPNRFLIYSVFLGSNVINGALIHRSFMNARWNLFFSEQQLQSLNARLQTELDNQIRLSQELAKARDAAQAATRAKSAFLAAMSHEIRTPMNGVIGMTSLLLDTELTPEQREFTSTIRASGEALLTIINDILDFSKIEAGKMDLENQPFNLRECVESALDLVTPQATDKGLNLAYLVDANVPAAVCGDVTRLRQIIVNLLSNAIKFTRQGDVVVEVKTDRESLSAISICFSVRDTGIGIPPDRMERLFQSFSQVDSSTTRKYGGTGLGLAISKRLAELMGGTMWAESAVNQGSTFHFTIQAESAPAPALKYLQPTQPDLSHKRVLIVGDNATNQSILIRHTQAWGIKLQATASPSEALEWLRQGAAFDAAILDTRLDANIM